MKSILFHKFTYHILVLSQLFWPIYGSGEIFIQKDCELMGTRSECVAERCTEEAAAYGAIPRLVEDRSALREETLSEAPLALMAPLIDPFVESLGLTPQDGSRISQVLEDFTEKERKEILPFFRYLPSRQINPQYEPAEVIELLAGMPSEMRSNFLGDSILNILFPIIRGAPSFLRGVKTIRGGDCIHTHWPRNELGCSGNPLVSGAFFVATVNGGKENYDLYKLVFVIAKIPSVWMDMYHNWFKATLPREMPALDRLKMVSGLVALPAVELRFSRGYTLTLITSGMTVDEQLAIIHASYTLPEKIRNTILPEMMPGLVTEAMSGFERASLLQELALILPEIQVEGIDQSRAFARMVLPILKIRTTSGERREAIHALEGRFRALTSEGQRATCRIADDFARIIDSDTGRRTLWTAGFIANVASHLQYVRREEYAEILDILQPIMRVKVAEEDHRFLVSTILSLAGVRDGSAPQRAEQILLERG